VVFDDFLPHLNAVPPDRRVAIVTDKASGSYAAPLTITVHVEPSDRSVNYVANRVTKEFCNGFIVSSTTDELEGTLQNGQTLTLSASGDVSRTYWVGVGSIEVTIVTDDSVPFEGSLDIMAIATRGNLYHSLKGDTWSEGSIVTITSDAAPRFIAIDSDGIASEVITKIFQEGRGFERRDGNRRRALRRSEDRLERVSGLRPAVRV
jgi:hypothetical protein